MATTTPTVFLVPSMSSRSQESSNVILDEDNPVYGQPTGFTTGFAATYTASSTVCEQTVYAQSLSSAANGIPLFDPSYDIITDAPGLVIGDVGWVNIAGEFGALFNVFGRNPPDGLSPKNFKPLSPLPLKHTLGFFPPGTALTSDGIEANSEPGSSLIDFNTTVSHGAILCLPEGADRLDLVDTDALRSYVAEHALDWYRFVNGYARGAQGFKVLNGSLFLVTGADSAPKWSTVVVDKAKGPVHVGRYNKDEHTWNNFSYNIANAKTNQTGPDLPNTLGICFIRGFAISLGSALWTHYGIPADRTAQSAFALRLSPTLMPSTTTNGRPSWYSNATKWFSLRKRGPKHSFVESAPVNTLALVLQIMLAKAPSADVLMAHTSIFAGAEDFDFYYPGIFDKLTHIFQHYDVTIEDGLAWMVPALSTPIDARDKQGPSKGFWRFLNLFASAPSRNTDRSRDDLWKVIRPGHNLSLHQS